MSRLPNLQWSVNTRPLVKDSNRYNPPVVAQTHNTIHTIHRDVMRWLCQGFFGRSLRYHLQISHINYIIRAVTDFSIQHTLMLIQMNRKAKVFAKGIKSSVHFLVFYILRRAEAEGTLLHSSAIIISCRSRNFLFDSGARHSIISSHAYAGRE